MANNIFGFVGLTGGAAGDLDDLIHTNISDGDISIVTIKSTKKTYMFVYDSSSAASEDTAANPIVVVPDSNTSGTGCWIGTAFNGTGIQGSIAGATSLSYAGEKTVQTADNGFSILNGTTGSITSTVVHSDNTHLSVKNDVANGDIYFWGKNGGADSTMLYMRPDGAADLYYAGTKVMNTRVSGSESGIRVTDADDESGDLLKHTSGGLILFNHENGGLVYLQADNAAAAAKTLFSGDPDGAVKLYYAGKKVLETQSGFVNFYDAAVATYGYLYHDGTDWEVKNTLVSGHLKLTARNAASGTNNLLIGDPDGAAELYYAGTKVFSTYAAGIAMFNSGNSYPIEIQQTDTGAYLLNSDPGYGIRLTGRNSGDTANKNMFLADPDGAASLYYAGAARLETQNNGVRINENVTWQSGNDSPEGVYSAPVGSIYSRKNGGANTSFYVKEAGTGNTGWAAK